MAYEQDTVDMQAHDALGELAKTGGDKDEAVKARHRELMALLRYEADRQAEERMQMQIDEDYQDHLQWRPEDAQTLMQRGQAPLVYNEGRQTIEWICGTEKRLRKDYKVLPREPNDDRGAEIKTKLIKYTDDVNETQWHRSRAFRQAATAGLSWIEEGLNHDPEAELIYSGWEDWRNVYRDSHSRNLDYNEDARYLFRKRVVDLDYAIALLPKSENHLRAVAGRHEQDDGDDVWYLGEKLTGASETSWNTLGTLYGGRSAYLGRDGHHDSSTRSSVELIECWYKVPERVKVFQGGDLDGQVFDPRNPEHAHEVDAQFFEAVKMRMRVMLCTRHAPCIDMSSPFKHQRFLLVPIWGYRRARDGVPYGVWRGMRDIQDDLNKRRSKALWALSVNRVVAEKGAVDDMESLREEAARPDAVIIKNQNKELRFDTNVGDFQGNLALAEQDSAMIRNVGGVTNENLGRDTNAQSGKAILAKQDQGSLTTAELFDNLLLAIKQAGRLRLSHIEQFYTQEKAIRIVGENQPVEWLVINRVDPATGRVLDDVTATQADFVIDVQDYRTSLQQAAMEQVFDLLGKIATFAPQVVLSVLDLVVETADIKQKDEWVARIRKINGQRDPAKPPTPEEQQSEQQQMQVQAEQQRLAMATARMQLEKLQADVQTLKSRNQQLDADSVLKKVQALYSALQAGQVAVSVPYVTPAADEIAASAGFTDEHPGNVPVPAQTVAEQMGAAQGFRLPSGVRGAQQGIQTPQGADNVQPSFDGGIQQP